MKNFYLLLFLASFYSIKAQIDWKRSSATGNIPTWMGISNTERGMAALGDKIYAVSRKSGNLIKVINGTNGNDLADVSNYTGVSGGTFLLNDVEVSTNGAILACNLTETSNGSAFKVYRWNSETATPSLYISYKNTGVTTENLRLGDFFSVTGDISGNAVIMAAGQVQGTTGAASVHKVVRWIVTAGVLGTPTVISIAALGSQSNLISVVPAGLLSTSDFYVKLAGRGLVRCNATGAIIDTTTIIGASSTDIKYFEIGTKKYIAAFTYGTGGENVKLIDVTNGLLLATTIASTPTLGTTANANGTGGCGIKTIPDPSGGSSNSIIVYALSTNNGISATTLVDNGVSSLAAPTAVAQTICSNSGTVASLTATGTNLKWYNVATGGTALTTSTALATGTYYVSQTVSNVESARTSVSVTITASTTSGSITQSQCGGTYKWPANGVTYTSSTTTTYVAGCNTATLNLTITPAANTKQVVVKGIKGVWVTNVASTALNSLNNIKETVRICKNSSITDIYVVVWNKARTLYVSEIMNREFGIPIMESFSGRDPLQEMITEAHKENIKVHAWFEYGFASSNNQNGGIILAKYPQWSARDVNKALLVSSSGFEWMNGINPEVQNFMKSLVIEVVKKYDVDGIQGDDRLPAMPVKGGYDDYTVALYKSENGGASPPTNENNTAWINWRTNKLTEFLGDLYRAVKAEKPNVIVSCAPSVTPWAKANYLQDWPTWLDKKYCDYVIPQIYRYDFASYQSTLKSQIAALKNSADKSKLYAGVLIQVSTYNSSNSFLEQMVNENRANGISGETFFFYEGLKFNSEYFTTKYPLNDLTTLEPTQPIGLTCYQVATWNGATCQFDITGSKPATPTDLFCYQLATWNDTTCQYDITGSKPAIPNGLACYQVATWNSTTCQYDITGSQPALPTGLACYQTATFNGCSWDVTGTPPVVPNAGTSGTLRLNSSPSDADLFAALSGADAGGTWTRPSSGYVGVYTYTVSTSSPCALTSTATVTVSAPTVLPSVDTTFNFCQGAKVSALLATFGNGIKVYTAATGGMALGDIVLKGTANAPSAYFLSEPTFNGESARVRVYVIINALPSTPTALILTNENAVIPANSTAAITAVGVYTGTNTPLKLSVTASGAVSYKWTLPLGVERTNAAGTTTNPSITSTEPYIYVKFTGTGAASPIVINVQSVNSSGCTSLAKTSASLTRLLPAAPATLAMNNGINTTTIKSFATYMGTSTVVRLSATATPTASSYLWELPIGVNRVTALEGGIKTSDLTSTDPFIYVNFSGVSRENTDTNTSVATLTKVLRLGVKAVNGVGSSTTINSGLLSTAKLLTLTAMAPAAPASLKMTEAGNTTTVTNISTYIGKTTALTLTAATSVLATSYEWELPAGVTKISGGSANIITVNFANVPAGTASLYLGVKAVNAIGSSVKVNAATLVPSTNSAATLLKVTATAPAVVGTIAGTLAICSTKSSSVTYTIPAAAKNATSYNITTPTGCTITNSLNNRTTIAAVAGATFTVNFPSGFIASKTAIKTISIQSQNGFGVNTAANKVLTLTNVGASCTSINGASKLTPHINNENFNVKAYPNPSSEVFTIDITSSIKEADIHVYDMAGRLIEKQHSTSNSVQLGKSYATGIYNIIVSQGNNIKTIQIIKK